jgi:hypothetical protein
MKEITLDYLKEFNNDILEFLRGYSSEEIIHPEDNSVLKFISCTGGDEGGSEYCETIFTIDDKYYRITYFYYSFSGFEYSNSDITEVKPVQRMTTFFVPV